MSEDANDDRTDRSDSDGVDGLADKLDGWCISVLEMFTGVVVACSTVVVAVTTVIIVAAVGKIVRPPKEDE